MNSNPFSSQGIFSALGHSNINHQVIYFQNTTTWSKRPHLENQDWTKAVWEFSRAHKKPCSSVHVLSPGYTETSSEQQWVWEALILCLCHLQHTHGPSLGQTSFGDFGFLEPSIILRFLLRYKVHPHSLTPAHSGERIRHLSSFHPTLLLLGIWRCNHSHHIDTELIAKPRSGWSTPQLVPPERQFNLDSLLQLV